MINFVNELVKNNPDKFVQIAVATDVPTLNIERNSCTGKNQ
jgi:hypothetical protein